MGVEAGLYSPSPIRQSCVEVLATNFATLPHAQLMLIIDSGRRSNSTTISYERQQRKPMVNDDPGILSKRTPNHSYYIRIFVFDKAWNNHLTHKGRNLVISIVVLMGPNQQQPSFPLPHYPPGPRINMARSTPGRKRKGGFRSPPTSKKLKQAVDTTELSAQGDLTKEGKIMTNTHKKKKKKITKRATIQPLLSTSSQNSLAMAKQIP